MLNYLDEIENIELFKGIHKNDLNAMLQCLGSYAKTYKKGKYISLENEDIKCVGIVLSGVVHMLKEDIWGNKTILAPIGVKQLFGETFTCGSNCSSSVTFYVAADAEILFLAFYRIMHTCSMSCIFHHKLIENMVTLIADKNKQLMEKLEVVSKKTLRDKILSYLSLQAQYQGKKYFEIPLGRLELADYLCADRSALTRELTNMKAEGLLDYEKNTFRLLDYEKKSFTH